MGDATDGEGGCLLDAVRDAALIVNALSVRPEIDITALRADAVLMDMTYKPLATPFLKAARERGLRTVDGLAMLIGQAAPSFEALFRRNLEAGAIGAGRIMSAAGASIQATLINCFVQPVGDCIQGRDEAGFPGIY